MSLSRTINGSANVFRMGFGARFVRRGFNPLSLFAAGEQGVWYDPSDFSTMFQDAGGIAPVTAVGQSVGLILDKSRGLPQGSELAVNGDFSNGTTGWTVGTSLTATVVNGQLNLARNGAISATNAFQQYFPTTAGKTYIIKIDVIQTNGATRRITNSTGTALPGVDTGIFSSPGTYQFIVTATDANIRLNLWTNDLTTSIFDNVTVKELTNTPAIQATAGSRPTLQQDATGRYYLSFDGVDDGLATANIAFTASDKIMLAAGVRKMSDAAVGILAETSANWSINAGSFAMGAPGSAAANFSFSSRGSASGGSTVQTGFTSPITAVLIGLGDIANDRSDLRINGTQYGTTTADQGTGNYGNLPLYIGRRGGTSNPFNGRVYGMIMRGGAVTVDQIIQVETWMNSKTGAY